VDFGIVMYEYVSVANGVREGARYGSVNCGGIGTCDATKVQNQTISHSSSILASGEVTASWPNQVSGKSKRGDTVLVKASHSYKFLFFPGTIPINSCAAMRLEQDDGGTTLVSPVASC